MNGLFAMENPEIAKITSKVRIIAIILCHQLCKFAKNHVFIYNVHKYMKMNNKYNVLQRTINSKQN